MPPLCVARHSVRLLVNCTYQSFIYSFIIITFFTTVLSHWDICNGEFGLLSPGKANCDRVALPNLWCMLIVLVFYNPPNANMDYRIFNLQVDVVCDCTRGCADTVRESALKVDSGRKIPCTGHSNLRQWRAGPTLYQLSPSRDMYILVKHSVDSESKFSAKQLQTICLH